MLQVLRQPARLEFTGGSIYPTTGATPCNKVVTMPRKGMLNLVERAPAADWPSHDG